jgi:hypothetical protein
LGSRSLARAAIKLVAAAGLQTAVDRHRPANLRKRDISGEWDLGLALLTPLSNIRLFYRRR